MIEKLSDERLPLRVRMFEKLPFRLGSNAKKRRWKEIHDKPEKPIEVNCFGTKKFEILGKQVVVRIFNEKIKSWQEYIAVEYEDICSICGKLMLVRAVKGTTWMALCSKECYEKFDKLKKAEQNP